MKLISSKFWSSMQASMYLPTVLIKFPAFPLLGFGLSALKIAG